MTASNYSVLSTIATLGSDVSVINNVLTITGCPTMDVRLLQSVPSGEVQPVAETLQVTTVTPVAANSTVFTLNIIQTIPVANQATGTITLNHLLSYTTAASGDTATTICNAWRAQLNQGGYGYYITPSGTTTLVLTAITGAAIFTVNCGTGSTAVTGTPGVAAVGTYAALLAQGVSSTLISSGHTYSTTTFNYLKVNGQINGQSEQSTNTWTLYTDIAATNYARFSIALLTALSDCNMLGLDRTTQYLAAAGAVNITQFATEVASVGVIALTLAAGVEGQFKLITMTADGGTATCTITNFAGVGGATTSAAFDDVGDTLLLRYQDAKWRVVANTGCTIA